MRDEARDAVPVLSLPAVGATRVRRRSPLQRASMDASRAITPMAPAADRHRVCVAHAIAWARRCARLDPAGFASALRDRLETAGDPPEDVTADQVVAWEEGRGSPSALTLLAAADVAGVEPEVLFNRPLVVERLRQLEQALTSQAEQLDVLQRRLRQA